MTGPAFRMAQNPTLKSTSELLLDGNGRLNGHAKAFEDDICLYGCASPVLKAIDFLKSPSGLATAGLTVVEAKSVAIIPPTAVNYTGTEADYDRLGVPTTLRPRPAAPGDENGNRWGASGTLRRGNGRGATSSVAPRSERTSSRHTWPRQRRQRSAAQFKKKYPSSALSPTTPPRPP